MTMRDDKTVNDLIFSWRKWQYIRCGHRQFGALNIIGKLNGMASVEFIVVVVDVYLFAKPHKHGTVQASGPNNGP